MTAYGTQLVQLPSALGQCQALRGRNGNTSLDVLRGGLTCSVRTRQSVAASLSRAFSALSLWVVQVTFVRLRRLSTWMKSLGSGGTSFSLAPASGLGVLK